MFVVIYFSCGTKQIWVIFAMSLDNLLLTIYDTLGQILGLILSLYEISKALIAFLTPI